CGLYFCVSGQNNRHKQSNAVLSLSLSLSLTLSVLLTISLLHFLHSCSVAHLETGCRGKVQNPGALQFERVVVERLKTPLSMLCFDSSDNILLPLHDQNEVHVYSKHGQFVRKIGDVGDHRWPCACVASSCGRVFVSEHKANCVKVFGADGIMEC